MDTRPNIQKMKNRVLSQGSAECFKDIPIKHEAEAEAQTEAQHQNFAHLFSADKLKATVKVENWTEATVTHLVKTELVEFHNIEFNKNSHKDQKDTSKFMLKKIMKTETNIVSGNVDRSYTCEEVDNDPYNNHDKKSYSYDSDHERDPFADVDCDPIFSQAPPNQEPSASVTNSGLINSRKSDFRESLTLPSFPKVNCNLSTARILKHNFRRKTQHLNYTWQCQLCLAIQGSERDLKTHFKICAATHRDGKRFCVLCNKVFSSTNCCKSHVLIMHKNSLQCQLCLENLNSESQLRTHIEICAASSHKNSSRFCVRCNKLFVRSSTLKTHAFNIHGIARAACSGINVKK